MEFIAEAFLVSRFQEAGSQRTVNLDGGADNLPGQVFMQKLAPRLRVSVVNHVWSTPTLNSGTSGFSAAASSACTTASRVSSGSIILSIHNRAAP
jgi:hypothetical protein